MIINYHSGIWDLPLGHSTETWGSKFEELLVGALETQEASYNWLFLWWLLELERVQKKFLMLHEPAHPCKHQRHPQRKQTMFTEKQLEDLNIVFNYCPYSSNWKEMASKAMHIFTTSYGPKNATSHQKQEKSRNRFSLRASRGSKTLSTLWFWPGDTNFGLLGSKTIKE